MADIRNDYIVKPLFKYTKKAHVKLNKIQKATRDKVQHKIDNGTYKLEDVPCLCGTRDDVIIAETDRHGLHLNTVICKNCGLLRTNPRLDKNSLSEFYKKEYRDLYMESKEVEEGYFKNMIVRGREILDLFKVHCKGIDFKGMGVLEIGCSAGGILVPFLEAGATVKGYDYDWRYLDYGNNYNPALNLCFGGLENLENEGEKYNLIIANHVLEHLPDPQYAVNLIKGSLITNGILCIGVPGLKNPAYYFSPTKSFRGSLHIGHLFHFTRQSLMMVTRGFSVIYINDEIRAIFRKEKTASEDVITSEYSSNLEFIEKYEKSLRYKIKRLKIILKDYPFLLRIFLPQPVFNVLKTVFRKAKSI